jgi:hypothetical protein
MILSMVLVSSIKEMTLIWPPHAGKSAHRIAAVEITLNHLQDYRTEIPVLFLEPILIFSKESLEIKKTPCKKQKVPDVARGRSLPWQGG